MRTTTLYIPKFIGTPGTFAHILGDSIRSLLDPSIEVKQGELALKNKKFEDAAHHFTVALGIKPKQISVLKNRATAYKELGEIEKAEADLQTARELIKEELFIKEYSKKFVTRLNTEAKTTPSIETVARTAYTAQHSFEVKDHKEAYFKSLEILQHSPEDDLTRLYLIKSARLLDESKEDVTIDYANIVEHIQRLLDKSNTQPELWILKAYFNFKLRLTEKATNDLIVGLQMDQNRILPEYSAFLLNKGKELLSINPLDHTGFLFLNYATKYSPNSVEANITLGIHLLEILKYKSLLSSTEAAFNNIKLLEVFCQLSEPLSSRCLTTEDAANALKKSAAYYFRQALKVDPKNALALSKLAEAGEGLATTGEHKDAVTKVSDGTTPAIPTTPSLRTASISLDLPCLQDFKEKKNASRNQRRRLRVKKEKQPTGVKAHSFSPSATHPQLTPKKAGKDKLALKIMEKQRGLENALAARDAISQEKERLHKAITDAKAKADAEAKAAETERALKAKADAEAKAAETAIIAEKKRQETAAKIANEANLTRRSDALVSLILRKSLAKVKKEEANKAVQTEVSQLLTEMIEATHQRDQVETKEREAIVAKRLTEMVIQINEKHNTETQEREAIISQLLTDMAIKIDIQDKAEAKERHEIVNTLLGDMKQQVELNARIHLLKTKPIPLLDIEFHILSTLNQQGELAFITGGSVRDRIQTGRVNPVKDIDIVTTASREQLLAAFGSLEINESRNQPGLFQLFAKNKQGNTLKIEIWQSTALKESLVADATKRDFTINALYLGLPKSRTSRTEPRAQLFDPLNRGIKDLLEKKIDTIIDPEVSFNSEEKEKGDALRVLRCQQLKNTSGFDMTQRVAQAITKLGSLIQLPSDHGRINSYLYKIFNGPTAQKNFQALLNAKIFEKIFSPLVAKALYKHKAWIGERLNTPHSQLNDIYLLFLVCAYQEAPIQNLGTLNTLLNENPLFKNNLLRLGDGDFYPSFEKLKLDLITGLSSSSAKKPSVFAELKVTAPPLPTTTIAPPHTLPPNSLLTEPPYVYPSGYSSYTPESYGCYPLNYADWGQFYQYQPFYTPQHFPQDTFYSFYPHAYQYADFVPYPQSKQPSRTEHRAPPSSVIDPARSHPPFRGHQRDNRLFSHYTTASSQSMPHEAIPTNRLHKA